jgi:twitching motility two-component system response regulator PilH
MLKKILIVDDSLAAVKLIQGILEKAGYPSVGICDPTRIEEFIDVEHPGAILLDVVMPHRNGFQACRELKGQEAYAGIPVILVTSKNSPSDMFWGTKQGADGYITKPFTQAELLNELRRFV